MIVGDGLVASALKDRPGVIFHAAGVANSLCNDPAEFDRDAASIRQSMALPGFLVYVSTVCNPERQYARFKAEIEQEVIKRGDSLVVRLPILGGLTDNPHTLLGQIARACREKAELPVWRYAVRTVIDVEDAAEAIDWHVEHGPRQKPVEIGPRWSYRVPDIVDTFERVMLRKAKRIELPCGDHVVADWSPAPVRWRGIEEIARRYYA